MGKITIETVKAANAAAGKTWFGQKEMRYFRSQIESDLIADRFFVTSERGPHQTRKLFSIREAIDGGRDITTVGEFQAYKTLTQALRALKQHTDTVPTGDPS